MRRSAIGLLVTIAFGLCVAPLRPGAAGREDTPGRPFNHWIVLAPQVSLAAFQQGCATRLCGGAESHPGVPLHRGEVRALPIRGQLGAAPGGRARGSGVAAVQVLSTHAATIPIVGVVLADPVETGFAVSCTAGWKHHRARFQTRLSTKRLALLKEVMPGITRVAILWDSHMASAHAVRVTEEAGQSLGLQMHHVEVRGPDDFASALRRLRPRRAPKPSSKWAHRSSTPTDRPSWISWPRADSQPHATAGVCRRGVPHGLWAEFFRHVVPLPMRDRSQGAQTRDLPLEQPMQFELVINLKTAETLGLSIPPSISSRRTR